MIETLKAEVKKLEEDVLSAKDQNRDSEKLQLTAVIEELKKKDNLIETLKVEVKKLEEAIKGNS